MQTHAEDLVIFGTDLGSVPILVDFTKSAIFTDP